MRIELRDGQEGLFVLDASLLFAPNLRDRHHIRHPNVHPVGFPGHLYTKKMAERMIAYPREIIKHCESTVSQLKRG